MKQKKNRRKQIRKVILILLAVLALGFLGCYIHFFKAYAWGEAFLL